MFRFFASVAVLVVLGLAGLFTILVVRSERSAGSGTNSFGTSLIFAEQTLSFPLLDLAPREIREQLSTSRNQNNLTLGAVLRIVPTVAHTDPASGSKVELPATAFEFMRAIAPTEPDELTRSFGTDFFFGVHTLDENVPFLILPITSYENAFSGMLAWENSLNEDLSPLFTRVQYEKLDARGAPMLARFEDVIIRNYDVRALRNKSGDIRMLYSFPSRNMLIIAESPNTFIEALARLRAERRL